MLTRIRVWNAGDVLTASDLNGEFNNIVNNVPAFGSSTLDIASHQLINALLEIKTATQTSSFANQGRIYYQNAESLIHIDTGIVTGGTGANPGPGGIGRVPVIQGLQAGDLIIASNYVSAQLTPLATSFERLGIGTTNQVLTVSGGLPAWAAAALPSLAKGQCQLTISGANLLLSPYNGNLLTINSADQTIPDAGVTLAPTGLTSGQRYYIYAFMSGATMTLEAVTTAYATQAGTGVRIKSGDGTRTLVGLAAPANGLVWTNSATWMGLRSYFNPVSSVGSNKFTADRTWTNNTTYAEVNSEIRIMVLPFAFEKVDARFTGTGTTAVAGSFFGIGTDGNNANVQGAGAFNQAVAVDSAHAFSLFTGLSEATHFVTIMAFAAGGATGTLYGTTAPSATLYCTVGL